MKSSSPSEIESRLNAAMAVEVDTEARLYESTNVFIVGSSLPPTIRLVKASAAGLVFVGSIPTRQKKSLYALNVGSSLISSNDRKDSRFVVEFVS